MLGLPLNPPPTLHWARHYMGTGLLSFSLCRLASSVAREGGWPKLTKGANPAPICASNFFCGFQLNPPSPRSLFSHFCLRGFLELCVTVCRKLPRQTSWNKKTPKIDAGRYCYSSSLLRKRKPRNRRRAGEPDSSQSHRVVGRAIPRRLLPRIIPGKLLASGAASGASPRDGRDTGSG